VLACRPVLLSVCIPTHDGRRAELAEALEAITSQLGPEHAGRVEICVTDNASADGTEELVTALARAHPIVYHRHPQNIGPGENVMASATLGSGRWLWLHSSDDTIVPGAVDAVLRWVESAPTLVGLSLARARLERGMRYEIEPEPSVIAPDQPGRRQIFADSREALAQVGIMQTFLTSTIVRRDAWEQALARDPDLPIRLAPHFPQTYVIGRALLDDGGGWGWEPRKLVLNRTGNELFSELGGSRVTASVMMPTELERLWRTLLGPRDATMQQLRERLRLIWAAPGWLDMAKLGPAASTVTDLQLLGIAGPLWRLPQFWTRTVPRLAMPHLVAHAARSTRLRTIRMPRLPAGRADAARITVDVPPTAEAGAFLRLPCTIEAVGRAALRTAMPAPVYLVVAWRGARENGRPIEQRRALPRTVRPGDPLTLDVTVSAPWTPGEHVLTIGLEQENGAGMLTEHVAAVHVIPQPGADGSDSRGGAPPTERPDRDDDGGAGGDGERRGTLRDEVDRAGPWWHAIDLGEVVTPGTKTPAILEAELAGLRLPDLRGRTVLDIGAWDGFYSFAAERAGASRVVALDHLAWSIRVPDFVSAWSQVIEDLPPGRVPPDALDVAREADGWDPVGLPGKAGFDLAHRTLGSAVESAVLDIANDDLASLGRFDVVLFLGVLYHLRNPLGALRRLHALCDDLAVIETEAIAIGGHPDAAAAQFMGTRKRNDDPTNWWAPTAAGLERWCLAAGFSRVERVGQRPPEPPAGKVSPCRVTVHAWR